MRPSEPLSEGRRPSPSPSPVEQPLVEEFQFLRCQNCQAEAKCPKLLPCLHSLCSACLQENSLQCPFCKVPGPSGAEPPALDNVFFESLQRHLALHRQVVDQNAACTRCKSTASFWCPQCEQLLCMQCYEAHRYYLKHETQRLENLQQWPVHEFLDSLRKTNNIFCNRSHPEPMLTNIYCRGCAKALCCSCAILDEGHKDLRCDIRNEVEQRQQELDAMTQVLGEHEAAFGDAQAQMLSAVSRLDQLREDTEELVRARIRQLLAFVRERERELLQAVAQRHQQDHDEMAGRLQRLDAVLQRIRTGSELVRSMKRLASDQEVLDMHDFLRQALLRLRQELPQSPEAAVSIDGFDEVKARLQDLVSRVTQGTDLPEPESTSPVVTSTPQTCSDVDLVVELQAPDPAQTQTEAVVPSMPGVHPVPMHAYSIQGPLCREEENPPLAMPQKRKFCQTESPRKLVKLSPEEENAEVLEPRPSTSQAVSPPCSEGTPSPRSTPVEDKDSVPQNNHLADDPKEAGPAAESPAKQLTCSSQRATPEPDCFPPLPTTQGSIVVISSSDDSDTENSVPSQRPDQLPVRGQSLLNEGPGGPRGPPSPLPASSQKFSLGKHAEPTETPAPSSSPAHPLWSSPGPPRSSPASPPRLDMPHAPTRLPARPTGQETALGRDAENWGQPAGYLGPVPVQQGRGLPSCRRTRMPGPRRSRGIHTLPMACAPIQPCQPTSSDEAGPGNFVPQPPTCRPRRAASGRSRPSPRGRSRVARWLNTYFALPLSMVTAQLNASASRTLGGQGAHTGVTTVPRNLYIAPPESAQGHPPHTLPLPQGQGNTPH